MPSSPGPPDYERRYRRFDYRGVSLVPQDALGDGQQAYIYNMRSWMEGTLQPRDGTVPLVTGAGGAVNSIVRLNDPTPFGAASPETRLIATSTGEIRRNVVGAGGSSVVDTGWSGSPVTAVVSPSVRSPRPYAYLADAQRQRKFTSSGGVAAWGLAPPAAPPTATIAAPESTDVLDIATGPWTSYGGETTPLAPAAVPVVDRVNTQVANVVPDDPTTPYPGNVSLVLESFDNVTAGMRVAVGAQTGIIIQDVYAAVSPTTVAAVLYDVGASGWCTIQPAGSFSLGQIEAVTLAPVDRRYRNLNDAVEPQVTVTRTIDYPVNALVLIGGGELVRIASVALGVDGVQSFRCVTSGTVTAGMTITGVASCRVHAPATITVGEAVTAAALDVTCSPTSAETPSVSGVQAPIAPIVDWGRVGTRATAPDDLIRLGVKISLMGYVQSIRLMLDVTPDPLFATEPFTQDYYFYEWRASDLVAAIQATSEIATAQVAQAQAVAVDQGQVDAAYANQYGQAPTTNVGVSPTGVRTPVEGAGQRRRRPESEVEDPVRYAVPRDGVVSIGSGLSRQLALGNDVWMTLECRVSDLTRVGTDATRTLAGIENIAVYAQISGVITPVTISVSEVYLTGGYGADVGATLPPYVYRYRYRSSASGEVSNPSPTMRAGVTPRRQRVDVGVVASDQIQCDLIDIFRFGGVLARWVYVGSAPNADGVYEDGVDDSAIDGGEGLPVDRFQPWPTSDLPRSGTCRVAGTSVEWISGDAFNPRWAADSAIIVNGRATQLYGSPASTTRLEVIDNCGSGDPVAWVAPSPTLLATPLPALWGGPINAVLFHFACGDVVAPGDVYWTRGNDPDSASDANVVSVTSASEPLINGCFYDGLPYVFSSQRLYRLQPAFGEISTFVPLETACTRGLWSRYALALTPYGIMFLAEDGIYVTQGGSEAVSLTSPFLAPLFPQDGSNSPEAIRGMAPIDFTATDRLILSWVDDTLYFDYVDVNGVSRTLLYEPAQQRWSFDGYPDAYLGVRARLLEPGQSVRSHLLGMGDGTIYQVDAEKITDSDYPLPWDVWTAWEHGNDPRNYKQWGDAVLDMNPGGSVNGITVTPVTANGNLLHAPSILGINGLTRDTFTIEINDGIGPWARNMGVQIHGECELCDPNRPLLYLWEPSWVNKGTAVARRATDWSDLGYKGAKFVQGVVIRANTFGEEKCVAVQVDSPNGDPTNALILQLNHDGEHERAYPLAPEGWTPFVGHLIRLQGMDDQDWALLDWRFVWEPAPELATQWETQDTTFDLPGFLTVHDAVIAYAATGQVDLRIWHDQTFYDYALPPTTNGGYQRVYTRFVAAKGKSARFRFTASDPFRLFKRDCSIRVQGWGIPGGYMTVNPFGGPHRVDGAEI